MENFKPIIRFMATSDVHYNRDNPSREANYRRAFELAYAYAEKSEYKSIDAVCVIGDFTDSGREEQFCDFKATLDSCVKSGTKTILSMASHEFICDGEAGALEKFDRIIGQAPDYHCVINGFHFISVTTTRGCGFNNEKREWIKAQLKEAAKDDAQRPIFFFQHPHITGTVYGSVLWGEDTITDILMNYPQIVDFSGHSHAPVNDPRSVHQQHFTCVGTGSFKKFELDEFDKIYGTVPPDVPEAAQFLIVEADEKGRVLVKPYDVITEGFFDCEWEIPEPWNPDSYVYTFDRYRNPAKPYFADDAKIRVEVDGNDAVFTFDQAKIDDDMVNDYKITIRRKADGVIVKQAAFWSKYYLVDMPSKISQRIADFDCGEYEAVVYARGFWENKSENCLKTEFKV